MNDWMENKMDQKIVALVYNVVTALNYASYLIGSLRRPKPIPQMMPSDKNHYCMVCRNWKPERAHHCSICETCVLKMDHHCPWLGNCVGYHNFKEFFLFTFYQAVSRIDDSLNLGYWNHLLLLHVPVRLLPSR